MGIQIKFLSFCLKAFYGKNKVKAKLVCLKDFNQCSALESAH